MALRKWTEHACQKLPQSCEDLKQGDAPATVYLIVLTARVYRKQLRILDGRGMLLAVTDDVKIMGPPEVIKEMTKGFPTLVREEE